MQRGGSSVPFDPNAVPDDPFDPRGSANAVQIEGTTQWCKTHGMRIVPLRVTPSNLHYPVVSSLLCRDTGDTLLRSPVCGKSIACFMIGGELRLCLPQVLNEVLPIDNLDDINRAFNDLNIYCKQANDRKLKAMKEAEVLPITTQQCSLITRSDCERVVTLISRAINTEMSRFEQGPVYTRFEGLDVAHNNFREETVGRFYRDLYVAPDSKCITCLFPKCHRFFTPNQFCHHYHGIQERHVCHWGFQLTDWRNYITVPYDINPSQYRSAMEELREIKTKFPRYTLPSYQSYLPQTRPSYLTPSSSSVAAIASSSNSPAILNASSERRSIEAIEEGPRIPAITAAPKPLALTMAPHNSSVVSYSSGTSSSSSKPFSCGEKMNAIVKAALADYKKDESLVTAAGIQISSYQPSTAARAAAATLFYGEGQQLHKAKDGSKPWVDNLPLIVQQPREAVAIRKRHKERRQPQQQRQHPSARKTSPSESLANQFPDRFTASSHRRQYSLDNGDGELPHARYQASPPGSSQVQTPNVLCQSYYPSTYGYIPPQQAPSSSGAADLPSAMATLQQQQQIDQNTPLIWALLAAQQQAHRFQQLHGGTQPTATYGTPNYIDPLPATSSNADDARAVEERNGHQEDSAQQATSSTNTPKQDLPTDLRVKRKKTPEEQEDHPEDHSEDELGIYPFETNDNGQTAFRVFTDASNPQTPICQFIFEGEVVEEIQVDKKHITMMLDVAKRAHQAVIGAKESAHGAMSSIREATSIVTSLLGDDGARSSQDKQQQRASPKRKRSRLDGGGENGSSSLMQMQQYNNTTVERELRKVTNISMAAKKMQLAEIAGLRRVNEIRKKHSAQQRQLVSELEQERRSANDFTKLFNEADTFFEYKSCHKMCYDFYPDETTQHHSSPSKRSRQSSPSPVATVPTTTSS